MGSSSGNKGPGVVFWIASCWLFVILFSAITAGWWSIPAPDRMDWNHLCAAPGTHTAAAELQIGEAKSNSSYTYLFGTDTMGRDVLSRLMYGARISLAVGLLAPLVGIAVGGFLGCLAGYYCGFPDAAIVSTMDMILAFPALVLLLAINFYLGFDLVTLILSLGFLTIPTFCRVARAKTLALSNLEFIQAARLTGAGDLTILTREIIPNVIVPLVVYGLIAAAFMIMAEGALSYLGLSVPPPTPSWGGMIAEGREVLDTSPHVSMIPAAVMFITILSFNMIGNGLREISKRRQAGGG